MTTAVIPEELRTALDADPVAHDMFQRLPASHQRAYVIWVAEAKKPDTRRRRAAQAVDRLKQP